MKVTGVLSRQSHTSKIVSVVNGPTITPKTLAGDQPCYSSYIWYPWLLRKTAQSSGGSHVQKRKTSSYESLTMLQEAHNEAGSTWLCSL